MSGHIAAHLIPVRSRGFRRCSHGGVVSGRRPAAVSGHRQQRCVLPAEMQRRDTMARQPLRLGKPPRQHLVAVVIPLCIAQSGLPQS